MEKLLLVEDDLALGQGVRLALQTEDRPVTLCRTLAQAQQALEGEGPFALAILDVNLPDGSGLTFLEEVRGRLPVILSPPTTGRPTSWPGWNWGRRTTSPSPSPWPSSGPG